MNTLRIFGHILVGTLVLLIAGCTSTGTTASWNTTDSDARRAPIGWTNVPPSDAASEAETTSGSEGEDQLGEAACFVRAPNAPPSPETMQVLKRPERNIPGTTSTIPAEYITVEIFPADFEGLAWLPAVCEGDIDRHLIMRVQEALIENGYDIGTVDGVAGPSTIAGLEYFKRDHGLYGDGFTHQLLEALGIDPKTGGPAFASL